MQKTISQVLGFHAIADKVKERAIAFQTAYKLSRLFKSIENELVFYHEKLREIICRHAELDEEGNPIFVDGGAAVKLIAGHESDCYEEMQELQAIEVELPDISFTVGEFGDMEVTMEQMEAIMPFIAE